jgi:hypothetical protein
VLSRIQFTILTPASCASANALFHKVLRNSLIMRELQIGLVRLRCVPVVETNKEIEHVGSRTTDGPQKGHVYEPGSHA